MKRHEYEEGLANDIGNLVACGNSLSEALDLMSAGLAMLILHIAEGAPIRYEVPKQANDAADHVSELRLTGGLPREPLATALEAMIRLLESIRHAPDTRAIRYCADRALLYYLEQRRRPGELVLEEEVAN